MRSFRIIEMNVASNTNTGIQRRIVFIQVYVFVFNSPPKPFNKDIVNISNGIPATYNEPEIWDLLYNEDFRHSHWISYNDSIDNLKTYLDSSIYTY